MIFLSIFPFQLIFIVTLQIFTLMLAFLACLFACGILILVFLDFRHLNNDCRNYYYPQPRKFCSNCYTEVTNLSKNREPFYCPKCGKKLINI
jgi:hypothetical protein